jgi:hypothetical protein
MIAVTFLQITDKNIFKLTSFLLDIKMIALSLLQRNPSDARRVLQPYVAA